jgi:cytochrome c
MIGGVIANEPAKLIEWLQNAPKFSPETAMPRLDIPERQARDMAAYLRTLK